MANTPEAIIPSLLYGRLTSFPPQTPPVDIAYKGVPFTPTSGKPYLYGWHDPNTVVNYGVANDGPTQMLGHLQVDVCVPSGRGDIAPSDLAGAVVAHFPKGLTLWDGELSVKVYERPSVEGSDDDGVWTRYPVTIKYTASV